MKAFSVLVLAGCLLGGCAQQTGVPQMAEQSQEAATQGSSVNVWIQTNPNGAPTVPITSLGPVGLETSLADVFGPDETKTLAHSGAHVIHGITLNITTGGTTPGLTSTATGTQTVNPNQTPQASIAAPIGVAPGGLVDQGATAGLGSGTVSSEKQSEIDQKLADLQTSTSKLEAFLPLLEQFFGQEATGTPETQPAETP